jgi:hypothetical protein
MLALKVVRDARLPRPDALGGTKPSNRGIENRAVTSRPDSAVEAAAERRAN